MQQSSPRAPTGSDPVKPHGRLRRIWNVLYGTCQNFNAITGTQRAAAFSYYAFFSIFPLFALMLWVGSWFVQPEQVVATIREFFPLGGPESQLVWEGVASLQQARGFVSAAFFLAFLWVASRFFLSLVHGVAAAWGGEQLPWWQLRLKNFVMVLTVGGGLLLGIFAPLLLQVARNVMLAAESLLEERFPGLEIEPYLHLADLARYVLGTGLLFYAFAILYMLAPRHRVAFRQVWLPALLVSALLQAGQVFFVNYLPGILKYSAVYGALGSVMFLLLWIYVAGIIILGGGCLCAAMAGKTAIPAAATPSTPEY